MNKLNLLKEVLVANRTVRMVDEDIYSVMDESHRTYQYDSLAKPYDFVIGNRLYNRVMWGTTTSTYRSFASQAVKSKQGRMLDVGCGSLLFTWGAYEQSRRPIIACDESLDMLRRARGRLRNSLNGLQERLVLLQADIWDLPFNSRSFETVLNMNVLHHHIGAKSLLGRLIELLTVEGCFYLTTLVINNRPIGDCYLRFLYRRGWLARPRTSEILKKLMRDKLSRKNDVRIEGNMAYVTMT